MCITARGAAGRAGGHLAVMCLPYSHQVVHTVHWRHLSGYVDSCVTSVSYGLNRPVVRLYTRAGGLSRDFAACLISSARWSFPEQRWGCYVCHGCCWRAALWRGSPPTRGAAVAQVRRGAHAHAEAGAFAACGNCPASHRSPLVSAADASSAWQVAPLPALHRSAGGARRRAPRRGTTL